MADNISELRLALQAAGFAPIPVAGKRALLEGWSTKSGASAEEVVSWGKRFPQWTNTGILTERTPACDIDIKLPEAANAVDELARDWFDGRGKLLTRFGEAPKRAFLFRTSKPFGKLQVSFAAPDGSTHKIEILGEGQQIVVAGMHPGTRRPYSWHGGHGPGPVAWNELPEIDETEARDFLTYCSDVLNEKFGFQPVQPNGPAPTGFAEHDPVNVDARLSTMTYQGPAGCNVNDTQMSVIPALLRRAIHPDDVVDKVVDATMAMAKRCGLAWSREAEIKQVRRRVNSALHNLLLRDYDHTAGEIPVWLPGEFHQRWVEILAEGRRPDIGLNRGGFYVRSWKGTAGERNDDTGTAEEKNTGKEKPGATPHKYRFKLVSFSDLRPGPEPLYLVDELIPIAGLVDVWGKAKCYKSFWCLDLMLHVAMGWEYRDRYVRQGAVVYCAFEGAHGYKKRIEALRRHYKIEDGSNVPLYVMPGQANLIKEHGVLIGDIKAQLGDIGPAAVVLDTLNKSLHGSENKDVDMGEYIRAAEAIRDTFHCVVIIVHHCGYDDTRPRGHSSLPGAVDAQLSVTRTESTVTVTVEMMRDGPEDTVVTGVAQSVEVGQDMNGKLLSSLVLIPGETPAYATERNKWSRPLQTFYTAAKEAIAAHGTPFQPEVGVLPVRAADLEAVRDEFYKRYAKARKTETRRKAPGARRSGAGSTRLPARRSCEQYGTAESA